MTRIAKQTQRMYIGGSRCAAIELVEKTLSSNMHLLRIISCSENVCAFSKKICGCFGAIVSYFAMWDTFSFPALAGRNEPGDRVVAFHESPPHVYNIGAFDRGQVSGWESVSNMLVAHSHFAGNFGICSQRHYYYMELHEYHSSAN